MAEVVLAAEVGRPTGSRAVRRLRREGKIPAVIYGHGTDPLPVAIVARELRIALNSEAGANQLLSLDTGSGTYLALAREMQRHPVAQTVTHIDFVIVRRDEVISADVPIVLVGEALEVLSVAKIIADAIDAVFEDTSVSELFGGDNLV